MRKSLLLWLFILMFFYVRVNALELNSKYAVLYNLNEDKVIYELNKDDVVSVASLTKIMTTLVAVENIKDYNQEVILKEEMFFGLKEANAYVINLRVGQKVTYNDLLYGMFLASGADATRAVAISVAGSEEKFVELMNNKAKEIGLKNTHFQNTVGLDAENHHSTVNEIAILLKSAFKNDKFKEIFMTETYTVSDGTITVRNSMKKAAAVYGIDVSNILGAKTGYTGNAGRCLASIAYDSDNDITYLLVTTKASTIKEPVLDAS
ncbi:MAG: D-alanyl-D-alanine carboxypeptidase, partial [Bacilli bacterium]|nr:D-alanyl-D-alanine carboxypeptidase [Bacilli bacterium]